MASAMVLMKAGALMSPGWVKLLEDLDQGAATGPLQFGETSSVRFVFQKSCRFKEQLIRLPVDEQQSGDLLV